jgi:hypothetical protein
MSSMEKASRGGVRGGPKIELSQEKNEMGKGAGVGKVWPLW